MKKLAISLLIGLFVFIPLPKVLCQLGNIEFMYPQEKQEKDQDIDILIKPEPLVKRLNLEEQIYGPQTRQSLKSSKPGQKKLGEAIRNIKVYNANELKENLTPKVKKAKIENEAVQAISDTIDELRGKKFFIPGQYINKYIELQSDNIKDFLPEIRFMIDETSDKESRIALEEVWLNSAKLVRSLDKIPALTKRYKFDLKNLTSCLELIIRGADIKAEYLDNLIIQLHQNDYAKAVLKAFAQKQRVLANTLRTAMA